MENELHIQIREIMGAIVGPKERARFQPINLQGRFAKVKEFAFENPGARISRCADCFQIVAIVTGSRKDLVRNFDGSTHSSTCAKRVAGKDKKQKPKREDVRTVEAEAPDLFKGEK